MPSFSGEALKSSVNQSKDKVPTKISQSIKNLLFMWKRRTFRMTIPLEERENFGFTYKRDWEIIKKTKNTSVRED